MSASKPCARCARAVGHSCCEPPEPHGLATLTGGDIRRIRATTGKPSEAFVDREAFTPEQARVHTRSRPANVNAIRDGVRLHLRAERGHCVFHRADTGCTLPASTRPLTCRLYPFALDPFGRIEVAPASACLAEPDGAALADVLEVLGATPEGIRALHRQLVAELERDACTEPVGAG